MTRSKTHYARHGAPLLWNQESNGRPLETKKVFARCINWLEMKASLYIHTMHNMTLVQKMCAIISKALAVADEADPRAAARPRARRGSRLRQPQQLLHQASAPDDSGDIQHNQHNQQTSPTSHTHTRPGSQMGFSFFTTLSGSKRGPFR